MQDIIKSIGEAQIRTDLPDIKVGDTVKVYVKVVEGTRERLQGFEGYVIAKTGGGVHEMLKVRRVTHGIGVERTFPLNSPKIDHIEKIREGHVRRSKLFYLRDRVGKAAKVKPKKS
jgi:large subunit ribosomal protein L19